MNKSELIQWFLDRPSYIREVQTKKAAIALGLDIDFVKEAFKEAKEKFNSRKKSAGEYLDKYLDKHNLDLSDVKSVKFYGNPEEPMLSIATKNEWYKEEKNFIEELSEAIKNYEFPIFTPKVPEFSETISVINILDAHIDKLCLLDEVNKDSSLEENIATFEYAFNSLLSQSLIYNPEFIVFVVGSDFYNANDANNTTKKGTPQNSFFDWKKSFTEGFKVIRRCIDKARQYTKVIVKIVKGNHDEDKIFYLGQLIELTYENDSNVVVDSMSRQRKYIHYGVNLIGLGHGDKEKGFITSLPAMMMQENKHIVPEIEHYHFYLGDIHHKEEYSFKRTSDLKGCQVTFLRAISNLSKWEYEQGYIGIPKTAEAFIHHKTKGLINNIQVHI